MRVELPTPAPGGARTPEESSPLAEPDIPATRTRRASPLERIANGLTSRRVAWPLMAVTVAFFTWSLAIRRPVGDRYLKVSARALALSIAPNVKSNATAADVARLQQEVTNLSKVMISRRKEILPFLNALESSARANGWRCERSMKAPLPFGNSLTNFELHPVVFRLQPSAEVAPGLFPRLMEWLDSVPQLEKRGEVSSMQVQAGISGIQSAEVTIHFFSLPAHEETAAK